MQDTVLGPAFLHINCACVCVRERERERYSLGVVSQFITPLLAEGSIRVSLSKHAYRLGEA